MLYLAVILLYLMTILTTRIQESNLITSVSILIIVIFTNLSSGVFFKSANHFTYHKLSPLKSIFLILNLLISRFILQFIIGTIFIFLLKYILDIGVWHFVNLFLLLVILLASIESFAFWLNIMEYSKTVYFVAYYVYFAITFLLLLILSPYEYEVYTWSLILINIIVFVISLFLSGRQWDKMEVK